MLGVEAQDNAIPFAFSSKVTKVTCCISYVYFNIFSYKKDEGRLPCKFGSLIFSIAKTTYLLTNKTIMFHSHNYIHNIKSIYNFYN